jgi:hypothetical protein
VFIIPRPGLSWTGTRTLAGTRPSSIPVYLSGTPMNACLTLSMSARKRLVPLLALFTLSACAPSAQTPAPAAPRAGINVPAYCAERPEVWADSIRVRPEEIELRLGDSLSLGVLQTTRVGAADSLKHSPAHYELRSPVAKIERGTIYATAVGEAELRARPLCRAVTQPRGAVAATSVRIQVRP